MAKAKGLGRGFGSLLPGDFDKSVIADKKDRVQMIGIDQISPDPSQPRKHFDKDGLQELAESIKRYGILQPIVLTPHGDKYIIIAGERRYRASKLAGLKTMPALVRTIEDLEKLEISLIENVQRVDLKPLEQAASIARLHEQFNLSYQDIAKRLGKAHTTVVNIVRLLQLPDSARDALNKAEISEGHARAVLALNDHPKRQQELIANIIKNHLSVREAERFVKSQKPAASNAKNTQAQNDVQLEKKLSAKVQIKPSTSGGGLINIKYKSEEDLKRIKKQILG